jgi:hypothetical protein
MNPRKKIMEQLKIIEECTMKFPHHYTLMLLISLSSKITSLSYKSLKNNFFRPVRMSFSTEFPLSSAVASPQLNSTSNYVDVHAHIIHEQFQGKMKIYVKAS